MSDPRTPNELPARPFRITYVVIVLAALLVFAILTIIRVIDPTKLPGLNTEIMQAHWAAVFGIPLSALLALFRRASDDDSDW